MSVVDIRKRNELEQRYHKRKVLDLFCGAGAASRGYSHAGWSCVGVDKHRQDNYPFEFHRMDAMEVVADPLLLQWIDPQMIHASPPCQSYSASLRHLAKPQPRYIEELRKLLEPTELPYVIENVNGAPLYSKRSIILCGSMFGKKVRRHRIFESNIPLVCHMHCDHSIFGDRGALQPTYNSQNRDWMNEMFDTKFSHEWGMTIKEARQAVPPYYTEYIGLQIDAYLTQDERRIVSG
jgi:DNA (cytosine-5)-methyltransferase 1